LDQTYIPSWFRAASAHYGLQTVAICNARIHIPSLLRKLTISGRSKVSVKIGHFAMTFFSGFSHSLKYDFFLAQKFRADDLNG
jgi:hypothetical protein